MPDLDRVSDAVQAAFTPIDRLHRNVMEKEIRLIRRMKASVILSPSDIAYVMGLSVQTVRRYANGHNRPSQ